MRNDEFEWDDDKAASNWRDHDITFEMACKVFGDIFSLEWVDTSEDYFEERFSRIGMSENRLLFVAFTMREDRARIITARLAEPWERRRYFHENGA